MNRKTYAGHAVGADHVAETRGRKHLCGIIGHILAHPVLVIPQDSIERQHGKSKPVLAAVIERHAVMLFRQILDLFLALLAVLLS